MSLYREKVSEEFTLIGPIPGFRWGGGGSVAPAIAT